MLALSVLDQSPIVGSTTPAAALQETLTLAECVDRLGYKRYWLAEHHASGGLAGSAPEIMVGQVAGRTNSIRVGSGGVMLNHYSALKVAECFSMLETLYPGRIDLGIGRAPGSDQLAANALAHGPGALGIEHFPAQIRDLQGYLDGSLPEEHPFGRIEVMPTGTTLPELWLLGSSDQSAAYAAHFGWAFSFAHFINDRGGEAIMTAYRQHFQPSARQPEPAGSVGGFVVCADTEEEALRLARSRDLWLLRLYHGELKPVPTAAEAEAHAYTDRDRAIIRHNRSRTIAGAPEQVRDRLTALAGAYGVDELVVLTICESYAARRKSYELLAEVFALERPAVVTAA